MIIKNVPWATKVVGAMLLAFSASVASAATTTVTVDNNSWDDFGSANNDVLSIDLGDLLGIDGPVLVDGIGWDLHIETVGLSWLSEVTLGFSGAVNLGPSADDFAGVGDYTSGGVIDLTNVDGMGLDLSFVLSDGILSIEFFEGFDDTVDAIDAMITGSLTISAVSASPVPVPAAVWLLGSGLVGLFGMARRRA